MKTGTIIIGDGGHAMVLLDAIESNKQIILGFTIQAPNHKKDIMGIPVLGTDDVIFNYPSDTVSLINGVGSIGVSDKRKGIYERFSHGKYHFATVIHPSAIISKTADIGNGNQIMAGAVIQHGCRIGYNTIINTRAAIDHDCVIGNHIHIAPGVTLSGGCIIGDNSHIGTGAVVIQGIKIGSNAMIAAGSVVVKDVPDGAYVRGNPARLVGE